jgi:LPXTG-motif cell wall-anchored protein
MNTTTLFAILGLVVIVIVAIVYWRRRKSPASRRRPAESEDEESSFEQTETEKDEEVEIDASATYDRNNIVQIKNQYGGCMSLPDANNGSVPWIQKCNSSDVKQRWLYDAKATRLKSALGSCVADKKNGVVGWVCEDESEDQRWRYNADDGSFERVDEGTCLETDSNENDSEIRTSACARGAKQRWFVKKVAYIK